MVEALEPATNAEAGGALVEALEPATNAEAGGALVEALEPASNWIRTSRRLESSNARP